MKYIFIILLALVVILLSIRLISGEDDWICQDGQWVKHGAPSSPMPQTECK